LSVPLLVRLSVTALLISDQLLCLQNLLSKAGFESGFYGWFKSFFKRFFI